MKRMERDLHTLFLFLSAVLLQSAQSLPWGFTGFYVPNFKTRQPSGPCWQIRMNSCSTIFFKHRSHLGACFNVGLVGSAIPSVFLHHDFPETRRLVFLCARFGITKKAWTHAYIWNPATASRFCWASAKGGWSRSEFVFVFAEGGWERNRKIDENHHLSESSSFDSVYLTLIASSY